MMKFKKFSMWLFILLLFPILSGCGVGKVFNNGYNHRNYIVIVPRIIQTTIEIFAGGKYVAHRKLG